MELVLQIQIIAQEMLQVPLQINSMCAGIQSIFGIHYINKVNKYEASVFPQQ